jgi:hypothetical protein
MNAASLETQKNSQNSKDPARPESAAMDECTA